MWKPNVCLPNSSNAKALRHPKSKPVEMESTNPDQSEAERGKNAELVAPAPPAAPGKLTPEEQMDLYEKELKENDWGHQPC
jgi:hypothetical protein